MQGKNLVFFLFFVFPVPPADLLFAGSFSVGELVAIISPAVVTHMFETVVISCLGTLALLIGHANLDILFLGSCMRGLVVLWL